jgi:hypothetical protein
MPRYVQTGDRLPNDFRRQQDGDVVAALGVAGGEHLTGRRRFEQPQLRQVAGAPEIRGSTGPIEVHVDRQGGGRGVIAEPPLLLRDAGERQARAAELGWNGQPQITRLSKLLEVVREEHIVAVVLRRPFRKASEHVVCEDRLSGLHTCQRCHWTLPFRAGAERSLAHSGPYTPRATKPCVRAHAADLSFVGGRCGF